MEKRRKVRLRERVCSALDIAPNAFPGVESVEIRGRSSMCIRDGGRILEYTSEKISVKLANGIIAVEGGGLSCTTYHKGSVRVDGRIDAIFFLEE